VQLALATACRRGLAGRLHAGNMRTRQGRPQPSPASMCHRAHNQQALAAPHHTTPCHSPAHLAVLARVKAVHGQQRGAALVGRHQRLVVVQAQVVAEPHDGGAAPASATWAPAAAVVDALVELWAGAAQDADEAAVVVQGEAMAACGTAQLAMLAALLCCEPVADEWYRCVCRGAAIVCFEILHSKQQQSGVGRCGIRCLPALGAALLQPCWP
jgi:hypothetical protein